MKFIAIINKLLGLPKALKNQHVLEMDISTDIDNITISKKSYNQNETIIFLKEFYKELSYLKKLNNKILTEEVLNNISLLKKTFTYENKFYLENKIENAIRRFKKIRKT